MSSVVADGLRLSRLLADQREQILLVPGTKALALCEREGFRALAPSRAVWLFDHLPLTERRQVRAFVSRTQLSSFPLCAMDDNELFALVCGYIRTGRLAAVQQNGHGKAHAPGEAGERRRLVRRIDSLVRGRLSLAGRSYKLAVDVDLPKLPRRGDYEVVCRDEAMTVLARLAAQPAAGELAELLGQASQRLTRDWRPPVSEPDGLVLLRRIPVLAAAGVEAPAITPSQLARLADEQPVTLEVVVLGLDDQPLKGLAYVVEAPDAETYEGDLGDGAKTKITSAKKGCAEIRLKRADAGTPA